jgi:hypothetical protein
MIEPPADDEALWADLRLAACPKCGSAKVVPAVLGWNDTRYCLSCHEIVDDPAP